MLVPHVRANLGGASNPQELSEALPLRLSYCVEQRLAQVACLTSSTN